MTEQEAYVTMNGDARDSVHEALNGRPKMGLPPPPNCYQEHDTYNHFPRATEWCPPVRCDTGAKYATVAASYGNIDQKSQYVVGYLNVVCVCVCVHLCECICVHAYMHACMCALCVHACMHVCGHECMCVCVHG